MADVIDIGLRRDQRFIGETLDLFHRGVVIDDALGAKLESAVERLTTASPNGRAVVHDMFGPVTVVGQSKSQPDRHRTRRQLEITACLVLGLGYVVLWLSRL